MGKHADKKSMQLSPLYYDPLMPPFHKTTVHKVIIAQKKGGDHSDISRVISLPSKFSNYTEEKDWRNLVNLPGRVRFVNFVDS